MLKLSDIEDSLLKSKYPVYAFNIVFEAKMSALVKVAKRTTDLDKDTLKNMTNNCIDKYWDMS
jgi:hypothetical protein